MRKTKETLRKEIEEFDNKLRLHYQGKGLLAIDGIIDVDLYYDSSPKILWILKEAYGTGCDSKGFSEPGKLYRNFINEFEFGESFPAAETLYEIITYTNYGIFNSRNYKQIGNLYSDEQIYTALKSCAIINCKKIMGEPTSDNSVIKSDYEKSKEMILEQINLINPDIVVCGNTFHCLNDDIKNKIQFDSSLINKNRSYIDLYNKRLFVDAYHPSYPPFKNEENQKMYCDEIINTSIAFLSEYNNKI